MDKALADLIRISNLTGKDPALTQAFGGNTSVKTDDGKYMFIKASGTALKDMNAKRGWRRMRIDTVLGVIKDKVLAQMPADSREPEVLNRLLAACRDNIKKGAPPSVESHLHALLDKCVIHLHPLVIGAYVSAKKGRREIEKLFKKEKFPPLWIPYAPPGFMLARKVAQFVAGYLKRYGRKPAIMILAKHGLFVTAPTPNAAMTITKRVIKKCKSNLPKSKSQRLPPPAAQPLQAAQSAIRQALLNVTGKVLPVSFIFNKDIADFIRRPDAARLLAAEALGPAELVYANGPPLWIEIPSIGKITAKLKTLIQKGRKPPTAYVVKGLGLFIASEKKAIPVIADVAIGSLMVRNWASHFGGVNALTQTEQDFIINWCSEMSRLTGDKTSNVR
jgi:rhamnose utilization protein RhaD (predicted bifunctional aldolase and dehydrogenase)